MIISHIVPIWLMLIICLVLIIIIIINKRNVIRRSIIVLLLFVMNLRLMIPSGKVSAISKNLDILFVVDTTISMAAEDYNKVEPRITAVKNDCKYIVDFFSGSRFSIITFGNNSQIVTPFTKDSNMTSQAIRTFHVVEPFYAKGSSLNLPLKDMEKVLKGSKEKQGRTRIVFFISDGEITNDEPLSSFSSIGKYIDGGAVLGYGTEKGGYMKVEEYLYSMGDYLEDMTANVYPYPKAVSKIDEANLKEIASDLKIDYINMSKQSNMYYKLNEIKQKFENRSEDTISDYIDIYYIFAIPILGLLVYEFIIYKKKM